MPSYNQLVVDLNAVEKNMDSFTDHSIMPMLKANAYGMGALELARFLEQKEPPFFGVSHLHEAITLREAGIFLPIFSLSFLPEEAPLLVKHQIIPAVDCIEKLRALESAAQKPYPVHLHVDTGFHRFGAPYEEAPLLLKWIESSPKLHLEGTMTHFSASSRPSHQAFSKEQIVRFKPFINQAKWTHTGLCQLPLPFCNILRIGFHLFTPHPAITLTSTIMQIKTVKRGESVGYDRRFRVKKKEMKIGIISFGYHDGWHLSYSEKGSVALYGKKAPMVGRICMDFQMIDITEIPEAKVGDQVELLGPNMRLEEVAKTFDINPRQLLSSISSRTTRKYIHEELSRTVCAI
ncbi:MAG: Alanine racemase 1 [Chlamydiales bacterium]|nr:Alanine racemase 1 [Chlamydiales bacterium]MCH9620414.1 Alanine racemase 1 [Chlamydiales bacterium]MCH9622940.1 Alanine racemase 1 [Chlamydiales bacterium]